MKNFICDICNKKFNSIFKIVTIGKIDYCKKCLKEFQEKCEHYFQIYEHWLDRDYYRDDLYCIKCNYIIEETDYHLPLDQRQKKRDEYIKQIRIVNESKIKESLKKNLKI